MLRYQPGEIDFPEWINDHHSEFPREDWIAFSWDLYRDRFNSEDFFQVVLLPGGLIIRERGVDGNGFGIHGHRGNIRSVVSGEGDVIVPFAWETTRKELDKGYSYTCSPFLIDFSEEPIPGSGETITSKYRGKDPFFTAGGFARSGNGSFIHRDLFQVINSRRSRVRTDHEVNPDNPERWDG